MVDCNYLTALHNRSRREQLFWNPRWTRLSRRTPVTGLCHRRWWRRMGFGVVSLSQNSHHRASSQLPWLGGPLISILMARRRHCSALNSQTWKGLLRTLQHPYSYSADGACELRTRYENPLAPMNVTSTYCIFRDCFTLRVGLGSRQSRQTCLILISWGFRSDRSTPTSPNRFVGRAGRATKRKSTGIHNLRPIFASCRSVLRREES